MGGSKRGSGAPQQPVYYDQMSGQDYLARYPDVARSGMDPYQHYTNYGQKEGRIWSPPGAFIETPEIPEIDFSAFEAAMAQQREEAAAAAERARLEAARRADLESIDNLWSTRTKAAQEAISNVDQNISIMRNHALTLGLDFNITPEQRQERINNTFAQYWAEEDENRLGKLASRYGNPEQESSIRRLIESGGRKYEWSYDVVRGTGPAEQAPGDDSNPDSASRKVGGPVADDTGLFAFLSDEDPVALGL